jgi:hypothetical protein
MDIDVNKYNEGDTFYFLADKNDTQYILSIWMFYDDYVGSFLVKKSKKNKGMYVVETKNLMLASKIHQERSRLRVSIKKVNGTIIN